MTLSVSNDTMTKYEYYEKESKKGLPLRKSKIMSKE
jgi:hypothetical protein